MLGQVVVDRARCDGPRPDQGQRRERVRVIERGDLGDHSAHDMTSPARERLAECVGPREHGHAAREQDERRRRRAEVLDPGCDAVGLHRRHEAGARAIEVGCCFAVAGGVLTINASWLMGV
ncbi:MAG: hypothetical protein ACRDRU_06905 [Pseudonocardiaceae bacterium]